MTKEITKEEILDTFDDLMEDAIALHHITMDNSNSISPSFYQSERDKHEQRMSEFRRIRALLEDVLPMLIVTVPRE